MGSQASVRHSACCLRPENCSAPPAPHRDCRTPPRRKRGWPWGQFSGCDLPWCRSPPRSVVAQSWPWNGPGHPVTVCTHPCSPHIGQPGGGPGGPPPGLGTHDPESRLLGMPVAPITSNDHFPIGEEGLIKERLPGTRRKQGYPARNAHNFELMFIIKKSFI